MENSQIYILSSFFIFLLSSKCAVFPRCRHPVIKSMNSIEIEENSIPVERIFEDNRISVENILEKLFKRMYNLSFQHKERSPTIGQIIKIEYNKFIEKIRRQEVEINVNFQIEQEQVILMKVLFQA